MNKRVTETNRAFEREQQQAHDAAERGVSFRSIGLERRYFCPIQLRELDDTWTIAESKKAICELIAKARGLNVAGITLIPNRGCGRVYHFAFSAKGSLIFTVNRCPRETRPEAYQNEWEVKDLRKVGKQLGIEGKLQVLEPLVLVDQEIRDLITATAPTVDQE